MPAYVAVESVVGPEACAGPGGGGVLGIFTGRNNAHPMNTINRTLIDIGAQLAVVADHTKYCEVGMNVFARLRQVDTLIVDDGLPAEDRAVVAAQVGKLEVATVAGHQSGGVAGHQSGTVAGHQSGGVAGHQSGTVAGHQSGTVAGHQSGTVAGRS